MTSYNRVVVMGRLTREPTLRRLPSGECVADLGLAMSESFRNKAGEQVENTCFVDVVAWGKQAEACGESLAKGSPVLIEGRLQLDRWQTKEGEKQSRLKVRADRVMFLTSANREGAGQSGSGSRKPAGAAVNAARNSRQPAAVPQNGPAREEEAEDGGPGSMAF